MIDYSGFAIPKSRPKALDAREAKAQLESHDKQESAKAKKRAEGRCEVVEYDSTLRGNIRCYRVDAHTHHLISGIGRRNKGKSILAAWKLRVCDQCHRDIHAKVFQPTTAEANAATIRYRRVR